MALSNQKVWKTPDVFSLNKKQDFLFNFNPFAAEFPQENKFF